MTTAEFRKAIEEITERAEYIGRQTTLGVTTQSDRKREVFEENAAVSRALLAQMIENLISHLEVTVTA